MFLRGAIWLYTGVRKRDGHQVRKIFPPQTSLVLVARETPARAGAARPAMLGPSPSRGSQPPSTCPSGGSAWSWASEDRRMEVKLPVFTVAHPSRKASWRRSNGERQGEAGGQDQGRGHPENCQRPPAHPQCVTPTKPPVCAGSYEHQGCRTPPSLGHVC